MTFSRRMAACALLAVVCCTLLAGCGKAPPPAAPHEPPWFADATAASGIDFVHDAGPTDGRYFMPQINGSGAALLDCNNDGRLDIYLLQFGGQESKSTNALYRQGPDGKFENISPSSGLDIAGHNLGVAVGDVNNDGWQDVVVTQYLGIKLFLNQADETFDDATGRANLTNSHWGASASFVDYDRDGWLDLAVVNYLDYDPSRYCTARGGKRDFCLPSIFQGAVTRLWRNQGCDAAGQWLGYQDCTRAAGLEARPGPGLGIVCGDFSGDGWPDIFVANDLAPNHLWINRHDGTFEEEAVSRGLAYNARGIAESNMGVAYGDVDGDALPEVFVTHFTNEHHGLWQQEPRGMFHEQAIAAGLSRSHWHGTGWGTVLADFDQEGSLDLALVNGFVQRRDAPSGSFWDDYQDRNQVFANDGAGRFRDISLANPALCGEPNVGRGLCQGDLNGDGAIDLVVTEIGGPVRILLNVAPQRGHWLLVRAVDPALRRDAIGAEVLVTAGSRRWHRLVQPGQSFQCSHDPRVHFGLGDLTKVDSIEVLWPDGSREQFPDEGVDRLMELQRGQGKTLGASKGGTSKGDGL